MNIVLAFTMIFALLMIGFCVIAIAVEGMTFAFGVVAIACFLLVGYVAASKVRE
jgi:uncharacterized protein (DUF697 family)